MITFPRSQLMRAVLTYFCANPEKKEYVNELARKLNLDPGNLSRALQKMELQGVFLSEWKGKEKYYFLNQHAPLFKEYQSLVNKTFGMKDTLAQALKQIPGVKQAYLYGSFASGNFDALSDIDILVIGEFQPLVLSKVLSALERQLDREINTVEMTEKEFLKRKKINDPFLIEVFRTPAVSLV